MREILSDRAKLFLVLGPLLAVNVFLGLQIHDLSLRREAIKVDYSRVNSIRYGILSVDAWKARLQAILQARIGSFTLSKQQEAAVGAEISKALEALVTQADRMLHEPHHGLSAKMKALALRVFLNKDQLRRDIPEFTQAILEELETPGHVAQFKKLARGALEQSAARSFDNPDDTARYQALLQRYQAKDTEGFNRIAGHRLRSLDSDVTACGGLMLDSLLVFLFAWWLARKKAALHQPLFTLSCVFALILLLVGLTSPMIDIDARIKSVDFLLWGSHIRFTDQILYFRSKTIFQMVEILVETGRADSIVVGLLILIFSILFPISKIVAMEAYLRGKAKLRRNPLVRFFAFKSSKWSMADVTVVAIFLAYVGFQEILKNQLAGFNVKAATMEIIATNNTALQTGYILFTTFVLFGFFLSEMLKRISKEARRSSS